MKSTIKRAVFLLSFFVFGLFLCTSYNTAAKAELLDANKVVLTTDESLAKENTYYFTNSVQLEFNMNVNLAKDTDLKYRVVRINNNKVEATSWSSYIRYADSVDSKAQLSINLNELVFNETTDSVNNWITVAPSVTYFVEIEYFYSPNLVVEMNDWVAFRKLVKSVEKETLKIVYNASNDITYAPVASVIYNDSTGKYTLKAEVKNAMGIVTSIKYFYSAADIKDYAKEKLAFNNYYLDSDTKGTPDMVGSPSISVDVDVDKTEGYIYVMAETGNGARGFAKYDIKNKAEEGNEQDPANNDSNSTGLFDYSFGEIILLVLVVVLVVSCALIITQKIIDYKKRLY